MISGILVYNKTEAEYNKWFIDHLIEEGQVEGLFIKLIVVDEEIRSKNEESDLTENYIDSISKNAHFAIMRNRNYKMSEYLEEIGVRCFNSSRVCRLGNDKWEMYREFSSKGITVMYTQTSKLPYPFVMKPRNGHGGENVFLIRNAADYEEAVGKISKEELSQFIYQMPASEKGRDIRVYVVGDTILTAMERIAADKESDFRANFSLGGSACEHALSDEELKIAARTQEYLKADFIGIDLIYNNGKPVINEIEDAVGTRMLYSHTDIDAVREYVRWIKSEVI